MELAESASTPINLFSPVAYFRTFAADTDSVFIIRELRSFLAAEKYNGFELQLSPSAYERAEAYLQAASNMMTLPKPEFTPDGDGGIDIEWERYGRCLVLSCRKVAAEDFISWREPNGRYEGDNASQFLLNRRLIWLVT